MLSFSQKTLLGLIFNVLSHLKCVKFLFWAKFFPLILMFTIVQNRFVFFVSLGVNAYPWEIVGLDLVTGLYNSQEFHFTTVIDSCMLSDMAHFLSRHKK